MRILFVIDSLGSSGKERQLVEHLKGLKTVPFVKFRVILLSYLIHYESVRAMNIPITSLKRKFKKDPIILLKLYSICREFQPDIISSWERMCSIYALPIAKITGAKFINGIIRNAPSHLKKYNSRWIIEKLTFPLSDAIVANSKAGLKKYGVHSRRGYYVHNGFDLTRTKDASSPDSIRKKYQITTPFVVGMIGGFNKRKDFQSFIKAAVIINSKRDDVTFLAIGDGSNAVGDINKSTFEKCRELVKTSHVSRIQFTGKITNVEEIIPALNIGVLLTNQKKHGEGISNSIMEYMAFGKPVIATKGGGTPEIVKDRITGFLIPNGDISGIVSKIEFLLDRPEIAKEMGAKGKVVLQKYFNLDKMTENYLRLYRKLLNGRSGIRTNYCQLPHSAIENEL